MEGEHLLPLWCDLGGDDQGGGGDATQLGVGRVHHLHHQEELLLPGGDGGDGDGDERGDGGDDCCGIDIDGHIGT